MTIINAGAAAPPPINMAYDFSTMQMVNETPQTGIDTIHSSPQFKGKLYGVELEIEAEGLYCVEEHYDSENDEHTSIDPVVPEGWLREQEDSINGVELISDRPYPFEVQVQNIERVFKDIERQGFQPIRTPRGSTHVHANVADLTWDQMKSFVMACAWAEPTLIELAGKGRKGNLFAQSYETTPIGWHPVIHWVRRREFYQQVDTHYMGTSFHPMTYLGSVEFRMGPSARTAEDAIRWLKCIDAVVTAGRETVVTDREPPFLEHLISKFQKEKQEQLRKKGRRNALEVWYTINEKYVAPPKPKRGQKKSLADYVAEYETTDWLTPTPIEPTPDIYTTGQYTVPSSDCNDPNCTVCKTGIYAPGYVAPTPTETTINAFNTNPGF